MSETLFPASLFANTEEIQPNTTKLTKSNIHPEYIMLLEMWANAQRDGRPAEYMAPFVQRGKVWLTPYSVPCSNAAKTRNPLTLGGVPQITEPISAVS